MNAHETAIRDAVDATKRQAKLSGARFRVERAERDIEAAKGKLAKMRSDLDSARLALEAVQDELGMAKNAKKAAPTPVIEDALPPIGDPL